MALSPVPLFLFEPREYQISAKFIGISGSRDAAVRLEFRDSVRTKSGHPVPGPTAAMSVVLSGADAVRLLEELHTAQAKGLLPQPDKGSMN